MNWTHPLWIPVLALGLLACAGQVSGSPILSAPVTPYPTLDPVQVARGRQVYSQYCSSCHGANAQGASGWATPGPDGLYLPPAHDDGGHTWHHSDRVLYETIRSGMSDPLRPNSPLRMPAFAARLSDAEMRAVIEYLKGLWSDEHRQYQFDQTRKDFRPTPTPAQ